MGANIPLPALDLKQQEQPDIASQLGRVAQLRSLGQQQQIQQQQIQEGQLKIAQTQALNKSYQDALTTDANGTPTFDRAKVMGSLAASGQGSLAPGVAKSFMEMDELAGKVQKTKDDHNAAAVDYLGSAAKTIKDANYDPKIAGTVFAHAASTGYGPEVQQVLQQINQDPSKLPQVIDSIIASSKTQSEASKNALQGQDAAAQAAKVKAEMPGVVAKSTQEQAIAAGMSPTGMTAQQQAQQKQESQRTAIEQGNLNVSRGRLGEEKRHNLMSEAQLSPEALDMAAQQFASTGQMPNVGRGGAVRSQIINAAAAKYPKVDLASNYAAFKANQQSLDGLQKQLDSVTAFESTANKNLDLFLEQSKKIVDTGSPILNRPLRTLTAGVLGSEDQAAVNAARQIATNEIAKVTSNPGLSGQLSDSARHEVDAYNPSSATLKQTIRVAQVLRQDMANRHQSYNDQIAAIKQRISNSATGGNASSPSAAPTSANDPFAAFGGKAR